MDFKKSLQILVRRKWVIIIMVLVTMLVTVLGTLLLTPSYTATATLRIATASASSTNYNDYMFADRLITTYINIATSKPMMDELKVQLGFTKKLKVQVNQIPNTELIQIAVEDEDVNLAMNAANTLGTILISQSGEFYTGSGKTPSDVLKEQVDKAESDLDQLRTDYFNRLAQNPNDTTGNQVAAKAVDSQQQLYFSLLSDYQQMRVREAIQANLISFVEKASIPLAPSTPNKALNFGLGFLASLVGGIGLAYLFENLDSTVFSTRELTRITDLHQIGWIPFDRKIDHENLLENGNSPYAEAFFRLRTNLLMKISHPPLRMLMVASALQGEGKTMVAINLALALSQIGKRVLLVECDMRLPSVHKAFKLKNNVGMGDYLEGKVNLDEIIQPTGYENLSVIAGGNAHPETGLLLDSAQMKNMVSQLFNFDLVIFDTPAVQAVTDASEVAQLVDGVLLVVRLGLIREEILDSTLEQLANVKANVIGLVINGVKTMNHYYYYRKNTSVRKGGLVKWIKKRFSMRKTNTPDR